MGERHPTLSPVDDQPVAIRSQDHGPTRHPQVVQCGIGQLSDGVNALDITDGQQRRSGAGPGRRPRPTVGQTPKEMRCLGKQRCPIVLVQAILGSLTHQYVTISQSGQQQRHPPEVESGV